MIKSMTIRNYGSIGEAQKIDFSISEKDRLDNSSVSVDSHHINLVNCIIGANASGKTTALKALSFLIWLVENSYLKMAKGGGLPYNPHKLLKDQSSYLEIEFINENDLYIYKVEFNQEEIINEYFGKKQIRGYSRIFEYARYNSTNSFKSSLKINKSDLNRFLDSPNKSMLSSLIHTNYVNMPNLFKNCISNINSLGMKHHHPIEKFFAVSKKFEGNKILQNKALKLLEQIDIGIKKFEFGKGNEIIVTENNEEIERKSIPILECRHENQQGSFTLPLIEESNGTLQSLSILSTIIPILETGGIVIFDELEAGLHPYVVEKIISLFENQNSNPNHAQLFFSTHLHSLLNNRSKTQIFIAEKPNNSAQTEIFRLDEVEGVRNDENYNNKYIAGTYGGTPNIQWGTL